MRRASSSSAKNKENQPILFDREVGFVGNSQDLLQLAKLGKSLDFNRQIPNDILKLIENSNCYFLMTPIMIHSHKHGVPCEHHLRVEVEALDGSFSDDFCQIMDLPLDAFQNNNNLFNALIQQVDFHKIITMYKD